MAEDQSAEFSLLIPREQAENTFSDAVGLFVGQRRQYTVAQLAKGIRLKDKKGKDTTKPIYDFLSYPSGHPDYRAPNFGLVLSITKFLGAEFTNEWIRLTEQGAFDLPDDVPDPGELARSNSYDNADLTSKAIDGTFDNDCPTKVTAIGSRMMTRGAHLVAAGRKAVA